METYFYKCPQCGFVHAVPAYWVSFAPEDTMELEHINVLSGEECKHMLELQKE